MKHLLGSRRKGSIKKGNVMTPLNWMCGISELATLCVAERNVDNWLGLAAFIAGIGILVFYAAMYTFYSFKDPDRLQTEEYNLQSQEIALQLHGQSLKIEEMNPQKKPVLGNAIFDQTRD